MQNACIIGYGTVGRATGIAFGIEKYYAKSKANITLKEAAKCRYVFICLPTPTEEGRCYVGDITKTIREILSYPGSDKSIFIIRSTVYPGYNKLLQRTFGIDRFVSNPEFLSEDTAIQDAKNPRMVVLGSDNVEHAKKVASLYAGRFKHFETYLTDATTAELIKYALNGFFATKVVFANNIFDYAQRIKANYGVIQTILEKHPWGSKNHFRVWDKGGRGAGGKCLRKDIQAIAGHSDLFFFNTVYKLNEELLEKYQKEK